jgi:hypothetical protein
MYNFTFLINQLVKLNLKFLERKVFNCASWPGSVSVYMDYHALGMNLRCFETCFNKQKLLKNKEQEQEKEVKEEKKEQTERKKIRRLKI